MVKKPVRLCVMRENEIQEKLKKFLKTKNAVGVSVFRMLISEIKNKKIADMVKTLEEEKIIQIIQKTVRKHKESIEQFQKGNRMDLVEKERGEMAVLEKMLPPQMSKEELEMLVVQAIAECGAESIKDMGKVIGVVREKVKGCADGKAISQMVKEKLV